MPQATRNPAIVQLENAATSYPKPHQGSLSMIVSSRSAILKRRSGDPGRQQPQQREP